MSTLKVNTIQDTTGNDALTIDSSGNVTASQGFVPSTQLGHRNLIINGDMRVAQRGTSTTGVQGTDGYYACDRWRTQTDQGTWTVSQSTDAPDGFQYSQKIQCTSTGGASGNADEVCFRYYLEGQDVQHLAYGTSDAKKLTLSFWVKTNQTGTYTVMFQSQNSGAGFPRLSKTFTVNSADTWEYKTLSFIGDTTNTMPTDNTIGLALFVYFGAASTFTSGTQNTTSWHSTNADSVNSDIPGLGGSTSDYAQITGVQLEVGSVATPFEHRSYGEELARCQRYYYSSGTVGGNIATHAGSNGWSCHFNFPVSMRTTPTVATSNTQSYSGSSWVNWTNSNGSDITSLGFQFDVSGGFSSAFGNAYLFKGSYIADAEL